MKVNNFIIIFLLLIFISCKTKNGPSIVKMKECLSNELANKAIVENYEQQDGLTREKDGVKYYEGYFNAEVKFITNSGEFKAGQKCKIIKATLSFMKTENGWNCQSFDISASNIVKIKEQSENAEHISITNSAVEELPTQKQLEGSNQANENTETATSSTTPEIFETGNYIVNGNEDRKIYFHNASNPNTRRKAYISTQEQVYVQKVENGFGYIEFTNSSGATSYGWVEMKYLIFKPE